MSKPTPGPWEARKFDDTKSTTIYAMGVNHSIASAKKPEDARLIAAAPDLLAACDPLLIEQAARIVKESGLMYNGISSALKGMAEKQRLAIKQAEE
jgi:hypothetical protein